MLETQLYSAKCIHGMQRMNTMYVMYFTESKMNERNESHDLVVLYSLPLFISLLRFVV